MKTLFRLLKGFEVSVDDRGFQLVEECHAKSHIDEDLEFLLAD
jgi:hypothetical protein